jgi:hypothetical protein
VILLQIGKSFLLSHNGNEIDVTESYLPDEPEKAVREFLNIVREKLLKLKVPSI